MKIIEGSHSILITDYFYDIRLRDLFSQALCIEISYKCLRLGRIGISGFKGHDADSSFIINFVKYLYPICSCDVYVSRC